MKRSLLSFMLLLMLCIEATIEFTPNNCVIAFDLDDTLTQYAPFYKAKVFGYGLSLNPFKSKESWNYIKALNAMRNFKKKKVSLGNQDEAYQEIIGGGFLQLTYAGIQEPNLRPYVQGLIDLIWNNATFKDGIPQLLTYLHEQGYELWIATNKDHVSYTQIVEVLGKECFKLSPLIKHSFVVWPSKDILQKLYTLDSKENSEFQKLIDIIPTIHETPFIHHSHTPKPGKEYYDKMKEYTNKRTIIFFDDRKDNIAEAVKSGIQAFRITNPSDIIKQLEKLNILNPARDPKFYEQLKEQTVFKKILFWV